jgi:hypothetical protein
MIEIEGPTEVVQHFDNRGSSHGQKGTAARHIIKGKVSLKRVTGRIFETSNFKGER